MATGACVCGEREGEREKALLIEKLSQAASFGVEGGGKKWNSRGGKEENKGGKRCSVVPQVWIPFVLLKIKVDGGQGESEDGFNLRWKQGRGARDGLWGGCVNPKANRAQTKRSSACHLLHAENPVNLFSSRCPAPLSPPSDCAKRTFAQNPFASFIPKFTPSPPKIRTSPPPRLLPNAAYRARSVAPHCTHPGLAAPDGPGPDGARLLVPAEDFGNAAVGDPQLPGDHAGPDAVVSHLHDLMADVVGQWAPVDENPSELVHPALAQRGGHWEWGGGGKKR